MKNHWKTLLAAVVLSGAASSIAIADGYEPAGKGFAPPPVVNWSGVYLGIDGGYAWSDIDARVVFADEDDFEKGDRFSFDDENGIWGGHVGVQRQYGTWVFGLEAAVYSGNLEGSDSFVVEEEGDEDAEEALFRLQGEIGEIYLITGRLGYAAGNWLPYVKAGYATAEVQIKGAEFEDGDLEGRYRSPGQWYHGWAVGGGVEYLHDKRFRIGVDYNYIDLGSEAHNGRFGDVDPDDPPDDPGIVNFDVDTQVQTLMARVGILFPSQ